MMKMEFQNYITEKIMNPSNAYCLNSVILPVLLIDVTENGETFYFLKIFHFLLQSGYNSQLL